MKFQDLLLLLAVVVIVILVISRADVVRQGLDQVLSPQPTANPSVCDNFRFQGLLPRGSSARQIEPLDTDGDGVQECVVLYKAGPGTAEPSRASVHGLVYRFHVTDVAGTNPDAFPVRDMRRYELRTDLGRDVVLGVAASGSSDFQALVMNADTKDGPELVVVSHDSQGRLVCLSVFRWRDEERGYQLVGYARGDWLETVPSPPVRYIDEVLVCDRQWPAEADEPDRATGQAFSWSNGKLVLDPHHGKVICSE